MPLLPPCGFGLNALGKFTLGSSLSSLHLLSLVSRLEPFVALTLERFGRAAIAAGRSPELLTSTAPIAVG